MLNLLRSHRSAEQRSSNAERRGGTSVVALEEVLSTPLEQQHQHQQPSERRRFQRFATIRSRSADPPFDGATTSTGRVHMRASVLRVGGFLTTLSGRRHVVYATQDSPISYEQMLALDENNPRRGVMKMVMNQLPTVCAGRADLGCECHICMDNFKRGTKIMQLPCEHRFCQGCIRKWLHDHRTCPVCRYEFPDAQTTFLK
ncbi:g6570 [Coccomyxa elongata]